MTYELAKELKDAGFPRNGILDDSLNPSRGELLWVDTGGRVRERRHLLDSDVERIPASEWVYAPTLSELIEACGGGLSLTDFGNKWKASVSREGLYWYAEGSTPEEAVARLWLELNKK